jgi:hypothetical protein
MDAERSTSIPRHREIAYRDRVVPLHGASGCSQSLGDQVEVCVVDSKRGMCLGRGREVVDHSDVKLLAAADNQTPPRFRRASGFSSSERPSRSP